MLAAPGTGLCCLLQTWAKQGWQIALDGVSVKSLKQDEYELFVLFSRGHFQPKWIYCAFAGWVFFFPFLCLELQQGLLMHVQGVMKSYISDHL